LQRGNIVVIVVFADAFVALVAPFAASAAVAVGADIIYFKLIQMISQLSVCFCFILLHATLVRPS